MAPPPAKLLPLPLGLQLFELPEIAAEMAPHSAKEPQIEDFAHEPSPTQHEVHGNLHLRCYVDAGRAQP